MLSDLVPLKGLAPNKAVNALVSQEKVGATDIAKELQTRRASRTTRQTGSATNPEQYPEGYSLTEKGLFYQPPPGADGQPTKAEKSPPVTHVVQVVRWLEDLARKRGVALWEIAP